ncbi:MAG: hypothetical protein RL456_3385 [Pseudomonadota bacterium]|jgi:hypothetical protein
MKCLAPLLLAGLAAGADSLLPGAQPLSVAGDLGPTRSNWTTGVWTRVDLPAMDLRRHSGLRIAATTASPRPDLELSIALREADGSWRYHARAVPLSQATGTATVRFADFLPTGWLSGFDGRNPDEDDRLDTAAISGLAIGIVNPFGAGKVEATVTALDLLPDESTAPPADPVAVAVSGRMLAVNGSERVPAGLFGGFNVPKGTHERYRLAMSRQISQLSGSPPLPAPGKALPLLTHGDRGAQPPVLEPGWRERLTAAATAAGTAAAKAGTGIYVEFWNEPYLNWANKNRVAFRPWLYDEKRASEGGPVHLPDGTELPHLRWTRNYDAPAWKWVGRRFDDAGRDHWRRGRDAAGKMWSLLFEPTPWSNQRREWLPATHPPRDVPDGGAYTATVQQQRKKGEPPAELKLELTAFTPWYIHDETQFTFWSARGLAYHYNEPMVAVGKALKEACPAATYIIGWGSRPTEDHLAAWELAYRPSIDAAGALADGVNDHDYGGDPERMEASAELVAAYSTHAIGKTLASYNTETAAQTDPAAYPGADGLPDAALLDRIKYRWAVRKLIGALARQPDKMRAFAFFGNAERAPEGYFSPGGEGVAFDLLRGLRGRLVQVQSAHPDLRVVAAVDGDDPLDPRPADLGPGPELWTAVYNAGHRPLTIRLDLTPPAGTAFAGQPMLRRGTRADGTPLLAVAALPDDRLVEIAAGDAVAVSVALSAAPAAGTGALRLSASAPLTAVRVRPASPFSSEIAVPAPMLALAARPGARAWLRIACGDVAAGELALQVGAQAMPMPAVAAGDNGLRLCELPLPAAALAARVPVTLRTADPARTAGALIAAVSIYVEAAP